MRLLLVVILLPMVIGVDLCHDPRSRDLNRSCSTRSFAVQIPSVHGNPYHALHDTLWAVAHYFRNCARHPLTLYILKLYQVPDLTLCERPHDGPQPDWGFCVVYILAKAVGARIVTEDMGTENTGKRDVCHTKETVLREKIEGLPETFRGLNWFVDYEDGRGHVRLNRGDSAKAFKHIRAVVRRFYGVHGDRKSGEIEVLIYDRSTTRRRKWVNARAVVEMVQTIPDIRLRYIKSIPRGLGKQVALFGDVDLLIAPHGAAMSNTLFMKSGSGVVEISKECDRDWVKRKGSEWTGWQADLIGLKLQYVGCRSVTNTTHQVDAKEVGKVVLSLLDEIRESRRRHRRYKKTMMPAKNVMAMPIVGVVVLVLLRMQKLLAPSLQRMKSKKNASVDVV